MKQQGGFIFIITLCITAVMSLLLLSSMQQLLLYQRAVNKQEEGHQRFYQLEHAARDLIAAPLSYLMPCIRKQNLVNQVLHQQGCSLVVGSTNYHYVIEDLGEHACLVAVHEDTVKSTHHFRFTLVRADKEYPLLVQIRVIRPASSLSCIKELKYVALGVSSWRYIEGIGIE